MKEIKSPGKKDAVPVFRRQLRALEREIVGQLEADTSCCGVTLAQCHTLLELASSELSLTSLAAALDLDTSTLSRTVDGLVRVGLVARSEDPADRRLLRLTLTPMGRAKVDSIDEICNRYYTVLLAGMSDRDQRCVFRAVGLLAERMRSLRRLPYCPRTENQNGKK
jgi:DNA-binding MarR family transcriptional regulator